MGRPKAWLPFGPEYLLQRVVRLLAERVGPVVVVGAPGQPLPALPAGARVVRDPVEGLGPLRGLATGLAAMPARVDFVYATSTDAPFLAPGWIDLLAARIGGRSLAIPRTVGRLHPLAALYRRPSALPAAERLLAAGRLRSTLLVDEVASVVLDEEELVRVDPRLSTLRNLNTLEDYLEAVAALG